MVEHGDERSWVEQSRQGDQTAFEHLTRRYQRMIYSLTYRMTGSHTDAEDLAQETFIQAYRQLSAFRREAKFSSWLYRIAVNHCLNWQKRKQRREAAYEQLGQQSGSNGPVDDALASQVQEALLKLHPKQRAAIILTNYEGLNHAQAAQLLGCSETTVSWRIFAARTKLKRLLKGLAGTKGGKR